MILTAHDSEEAWLVSTTMSYPTFSWTMAAWDISHLDLPRFADMKQRSILDPLVGHRPDQVIDVEQQPRCHQHPLKTPSDRCLV